MAMTTKLIVDAQSISQRLDNYLIKKLNNIPKSLLYRLIRKGAIKVNNKKSSPDYKLLLNDEVFVPKLNNIEENDQHAKLDKKHISNNILDNFKQNIILDHHDFIIINKPSGLAVHAGSNVRYGLIDVLRKIYGPKQYLELVHRLDRDTSGCLIIAKNRIALNDFHNKIQSGDIEKNYLALVKGIWPNSKRMITHPVRKSALKSGERMVVVDHAQGKPSTTKVEVKAIKNNTSLLQLTAITGRTHQLRVHCSYESCPIIGDNKYGDKKLNQEVKQKTNLSRLFLHAYSLSFIWGSSKNNINIQAPLDKSLEETLAYFGYI